MCSVRCISWRHMALGVPDAETTRSEPDEDTRGPRRPSETPFGRRARIPSPVTRVPGRGRAERADRSGRVSPANEGSSTRERAGSGRWVVRGRRRHGALRIPGLPSSPRQGRGEGSSPVDSSRHAASRQAPRRGSRQDERLGAHPARRRRTDHGEGLVAPHRRPSRGERRMDGRRGDCGDRLEVRASKETREGHGGWSIRHWLRGDRACEEERNFVACAESRRSSAHRVRVSIVPRASHSPS